MGLLNRLRRMLPLPSTGQTGSILSLSLPSPEIDEKPLKTRSDKLGQFAGWVYAAVKLIADDVRDASHAMWDVRGKTPDDWIRLAEDQMPRELARPNSSLELPDLIETTQLHLDMAGEAWWHFLPDGLDENAQADGLEIIYPHWVTEPVIRMGKLMAWRVAVPGHQTRDIPAHEICYLRYAHPSHPLRGFSPVEAVALSHKLDIRTRGYGAALMDNNAIPSVVVTVGGKAILDPDEADLVRERWKDRYQNRPGEPAILGEGSDAKVLGMTLDRIGLDVIDKMTRDQVLGGAYNVPPFKLGLAEDVNRANGEALERHYQRQVIWKRLRRLHNIINSKVLPRFGVDTATRLFRFDNPVKEDEEQSLKRATTVVGKTMATINQGRQMMGLEPNEDGDVYLVPSGMTLVKAGNLDSMPPPDAKSAEERTHIHEDARLELAELRFQHSAGNMERRFVGELRRLFSADQKAVVEAVRENWDDIQAQGRQFETRGPVSNALEGTRAAWTAAYRDHVFGATQAGWDLFKQQVEDAPDFDRLRNRALNRARRISAQLVTQTSGTTQKEVRRIIIDGLAKNESASKVAGRIRGKFDEWKGSRAATIARTETGGHVNFGSWVTAKEMQDSGAAQVRKIWVTSFANSRDTHIRTHRQERGVEEMFSVGRAQLRFPLDRGAPEETINCQCTLAYRVSSNE